jgi:hypothetical protein
MTPNLPPDNQGGISMLIGGNSLVDKGGGDFVKQKREQEVQQTIEKYKFSKISHKSKKRRKNEREMQQEMLKEE